MSLSKLFEQPSIPLNTQSYSGKIKFQQNLKNMENLIKQLEWKWFNKMNNWSFPIF